MLRQSLHLVSRRLWPVAEQRRALSSVSDGPVAVELLDRRVLRLAGEDVVHFLQGLITNDARLLSQGRPLYTVFLNTQGRVAFDALLHPQQRPGESPVVLLETDAAAAPQLSAHLRKYRLRAKVDLADASADFAVWGTLGGGGGGGGEGRWRPDPRLSVLGLRAVLPRADSPELPPGVARAADAAAAEAALRRRRLLLGVAEGSAEMAAELPLELNIEALNGVSFNKGCYIGQELTARTHFRGVIRKRVLPVRLMGGGAGAAPAVLEAGAAVAAARGEGEPSGTGQGERGVGRVLAADGDVGIALLRLTDALQPSARLEVRRDADGASTSAASAGVLAVHVPVWWPPQWWVEAAMGASGGAGGDERRAEAQQGESMGGEHQASSAGGAAAAAAAAGGGFAAVAAARGGTGAAAAAAP